MGKSDIKKFYERALEEGRFNSELFKELKNFSTENELKDFLKDKILPIAKEMGYDFSVEELLTYEKETVHKIKEYQLENVNGGVSVKNLALGGVVSLMALGAGIFGTMNSASATEEGSQPSKVEGNGSLVEDRPVEEVGPTVLQNPSEASEDSSEDSEPPLQPEAQAAKEEEKAKLIENKKEELTHFLERTFSELWRLIMPLYPSTQSILTQDIGQFASDCHNIIRRADRASLEEIKSDYQARKDEINSRFIGLKAKIRDIRLANMQVNDVVLRLREIFGANIESVPDTAVCNQLDQSFDSLMNYIKGKLLHEFNMKIAQANSPKEIQRETNSFENFLYTAFRDEILRKFPQPIVKNSIRNVDKLRMSYQHAILRDDTPQLINNRKPRLAQLLERDTAISTESQGVEIKIEHEKEHGKDKEILFTSLNTPFGPVKVKTFKGNFVGNTRLILDDEDFAPTYTKIAEHLDRYYREYGPDSTLKMLYAILNYLNLPAEEDDNVQNALKRLNDRVKVDTKLMQNATGEQRKSAAVLCGILMVCESGQDRSENGGKRERGVIRALIESVIFGLSETPFEDAFGFSNGKEGYYTPSAKIVRGKKGISQQGGSVRGKVVVGKVPAERVRPPIPEETQEQDLKDTENLVLSSDSYEEYEEGDIFESQSDAFEIQSDIFEIGGRSYLITGNPGPIGGCLWRILITHGVAEEDLLTVANKIGIKYNDFVDLDRLELFK